MNDLRSKSGGIYGRSYDHYVEHQDNSTLSKVQQQYWTTKHVVFKKLGKKEDEHITASDSELDTKLELFISIRESSANLQKVIEQYQDKLLALSHEENALGRFLKEKGKTDKTRAGKMMLAVGKTMSYASQQRLAIRVPLVRLHQEVETFRTRAITDTLVTVEQMETSRTDYRGALLWMKDISQQLDPDTYKQLEKFRKVQCHVRKTKGHFEKYKLDSLQKIDLLAASRCNMFSHALATYQNTLLHFWEKTSRTLTAVADSFKGYQHYEFSMLKELTEVGKKLADDTAHPTLKPFLEGDDEADKDRLIFFEEYHDEDDAEKEASATGGGSSVSGAIEGAALANKSDSLQNLFHSPIRNGAGAGPQNAAASKRGSAALAAADIDEPLLDLGREPSDSSSVAGAASAAGSKSSTVSGKTATGAARDLLTNNPEVEDTDKDDMTLLNEILNTEVSSEALTVFNRQWDSMFEAASARQQQQPPSAYEAAATAAELDDPLDALRDYFLPSQLLDMQTGMAATAAAATAAQDANLKASASSPAGGSTGASKTDQPQNKAGQSKKPTAKHNVAASKKQSSKDMAAWFNLFADLDPLANPDAVGKSGNDAEDDRNC